MESSTPRILAFAGSLRAGSYNKMLIRVAADAARAAGGEVTLIDLRELPLPIFDEDLEAAEGLPENARRLKSLMKSHHALLLACPEYNSSITGVLKNAIDWASREVPDEKPLECFAGKVAALLAASPGALGGLRGLVAVRSILGNLQTLVIPEQFALTRAHQAFGPNGSLADPKHVASIDRVVSRLVDVCRKLHP